MNKKERKDITPDVQNVQPNVKHMAVSVMLQTDIGFLYLWFCFNGQELNYLRHRGSDIHPVILRSFSQDESDLKMIYYRALC